MTEDYGIYCRPGLFELLKSIQLDVAYHRASGDWLWHIREGQELKVLDLIGGYGANLFGHNHPELVATIQDLYAQQLPILAQGSCRMGAAQLAKRLCNRLGDGVVIFANSGTETIEAALKHAFLQQKRSKFWAIKGAFHGKTLGAIQMNWNYRAPFLGLGPTVEFLDPFDENASYEAFEQEVTDINAIFFEPVLGEGGIRPLPEKFVTWMKAISQKHGILLIADEIQCGIGRTGTFLASEGMGIEPDYVCLSKSLGGGLAKIGALHIKRKHFVEAFSVIHTSTFAEDDISCRVALKALDILETDNMMARCREKGQYFLDALEKARQRFPLQIREIRGFGLMLGIDFHTQSDSPSNLLKMISDQGYLGYLAAAYFLNVHDIRIAPTLSQPNTLRIEPSAGVPIHAIDHFVACLQVFCKAVDRLDLPHITGFLAGLPPGNTIADNRDKCRPNRQKAETKRKVAFIGNFLLPEHIALWDPACSGFQSNDLQCICEKTAPIFVPNIFDQFNVQSTTGEQVHLSFVGLSMTAHQMMKGMAENQTGWMVEKINAAAAMTKEQGSTVFGLGSQTSIITRNGLRMKCPEGLALTSGNSLTVGMGILALKKAASQKHIQLDKSRLAIVGALGNIASVYAEMMAREVAEMVLIVRDVQTPKLQRWIAELKTIAPELQISIAQDMDALKDCSLIVAASNAPDPLIFARDLSDSPTVICDISAPTDVDKSVACERPNTLVIQGGLVRLPFNHDFYISGIPLKKGYSFACMAETMLMGLEQMTDHFSFGKITAHQVKKMLKIAKKHGFELGDIE